MDPYLPASAISGIDAALPRVRELELTKISRSDFPLPSVVFGRHQGGDKGFGAVLGAGAVVAPSERLTTLQFQVRIANSDWHMDASCGAHCRVLRQLVHEAAAVAVAPSASADFATWARSRHRQISDSSLSLVVGYRDLLAVPPARVAAGEG